jgi:type II secretory pathway pseudopilin PulG
MKTDRRQRGGAFTLVEVLIVLVAVGLLIGLLLPAMITAKNKAGMITCNGRLKQIGLAFRIWSTGNTNEWYPMSISTNLGGTKEFTGEAFRHFQAFSNELNTTIVIACPSDARRQPARDWASLANTNVSYSVNLDANETRPQIPLAGDRNLVGGTRQTNGFLLLWTNDPVSWTKEMHGNCGNVNMGDGSVLQLSLAKLREVFAFSGVATNRLAMP